MKSDKRIMKRLKHAERLHMILSLATSIDGCTDNCHGVCRNSLTCDQCIARLAQIIQLAQVSEEQSR